MKIETAKQLGVYQLAYRLAMVKRIVGWHRVGMSPEEIAAQYGHLSLAQVHAALASMPFRNSNVKC